MSYIHEALKKAQLDKDRRYKKYGAILATRAKAKRFLPGWTFWWVILIPGIILLAFACYSWFDSLFRQPLEPRIIHTHNPPAETTPEGSAADPKGLYDRAREFHGKGQLQDAKRLYQETLRRDPGYVDALNNLAVIHIHEKEFLAAQRNLEKVIRLRPGHVDPYYNLACVYALRGELDQSLDHLERAVLLDPSVRGWARIDRDLENLRQVERFQEILENEGLVE